MIHDKNDIVHNGLCIGCGLCQSIAGEQKLKMTMTSAGRLRPSLLHPLPIETTAHIYSVCPGVRVEGIDQRNFGPAFTTDSIWGQSGRLSIGFAADPQGRFKASTGGSLCAWPGTPACVTICGSGAHARAGHASRRPRGENCRRRLMRSAVSLG